MRAQISNLLRICLNTASPAKALVLASLGCLLGSFLFIISVQIYSDSRNLFDSKSAGASSFFTLNKKVHGGLLQNLSSNNDVFSVDEISQIKQIDGVEDLGRFSRNHFPITVNIWPSGKIGFGAAARADLFFESIPDRFLDQIPEEWRWEENNSFVPIMVPKFYLDLWNFGLAPSRQEYPALSRDTARSMPIEIFMGENGSKKMIGRFVAFSKRINSVLVPENFLQWANQKYAIEDAEKYFFTWEGGQINGPPVSRTELRNLPDQKLNQLVISSLEEPEKKLFFHNLNETTSSTADAARLIVKLNDDFASKFSEKIMSLGYETNREIPQQKWIHQITLIISWLGVGLGGLLSLLSMGTFTSSFRLMIVQSAKTTRDLMHLGFSKSQISRVFFLRFAKLFVLIWIASLLLCFTAKVFLQKQVLEHGLEVAYGLSWSTYILATTYAICFASINYWVIARSVCAFGERKGL